MKIFLRILSIIYAFAAVLHIGSILGFGRTPFDEAPLSWQLSDIFYGVKFWGIAAFFVAAISEILLFSLVPDWFVVEPEQLTMLRGFIVYHLVALSIYFALRHFDIK